MGTMRMLVVRAVLVQTPDVFPYQTALENTIQTQVSVKDSQGNRDEDLHDYPPIWV